MFRDMFSSLPHFPNTQVQIDVNDPVPGFIPRQWRGYSDQAREALVRYTKYVSFYFNKSNLWLILKSNLWQKYETNGKFQAILKTPSDWRAFFYKFYELEIYLGGDLGIKILGCG